MAWHTRPSAEVIELRERARAILAEVDPSDRWTEGRLSIDLDDRSAEIFATAELIAEALGQWSGAHLIPDEVAVDFVRAEVADLAAAVDGRDVAEWLLVGRMWILLAWIDRIKDSAVEVTSPQSFECDDLSADGQQDIDLDDVVYDDEYDKEFFAALPERAISPWANFLYGAGLAWVLCLYLIVGLLAFAGMNPPASGDANVSKVVWFLLGCGGGNTLGLIIVLGWYRSYSGRWLPGSSTIRWR